MSAPLRTQCSAPRCPYPALPHGARCRDHTTGGGWQGAGQDYGSAWTKLARQVLIEEPTCRLARPGCTVVSTAVDHIVPKSDGGLDVRSNARGVCRSCHQKKTSKESAIGRKRKREQRRRVRGDR